MPAHRVTTIHGRGRRDGLPGVAVAAGYDLDAIGDRGQRGKVAPMRDVAAPDDADAHAPRRLAQRPAHLAERSGNEEGPPRRAAAAHARAPLSRLEPPPRGPPPGRRSPRCRRDPRRR